MTPRQERIAFQLWWFIRDTGGECTLMDMARFSGASWQTCRNITKAKGWSGMYRKVAQSHAGGRGMGQFSRSRNLILAADEALSELSGRVL
ncbi:hypothetical protein [Leisingera sp. M658]|uniref:hypothetical protein n=1 Tax=Leisingera sp. M658 TaxID=2867015 RepID=UPI0021A660CE|nr:hypothetical protein [Leisingera sp. M658]UWQ77373.1 hypothetical protein K3724_22825 [Leisingera sp. M658]